MTSGELLIVDAEVGGVRSDLRIVDGTIASVSPVGHRHGAPVPAKGSDLLDAGGGAVIPGLHDHHLHLAATAALRASLDVGPARVGSMEQLAERMHAGAAAAAPGEWVRAVGYHESSAGELDRDVLDRLVPDRPVRVQHRTGSVWFVNSEGLRRLGISDDPPAPVLAGLERDASGRADGRLFRLDEWMRERFGGAMPDLRPLGRELTAYGIVGCTDATPVGSSSDFELLAAAVAAASMPQHVTAMTAPFVSPRGGAGLKVGPVKVGPVKVVLGDHELPPLDRVAEWFTVAHGEGRPVAVHVVTSAALAISLAAWDMVGVLDGDRIEHGAVISDPVLAVLAAHGLRVVTQPGFVGERGDSYLDEIPDTEHHELWRMGSLIDVGVRVATGSDAPYGPLDPWASIATATDRRTPSGRILGPEERVSAAVALAGYLSTPDDPGGPTRQVAAGAPADLCVLDGPLAGVLAEPDAQRVAATIIDGHVHRPIS